jgi:hypothetical protein
MDSVIVYVPRCFQNESESLGFKAVEDFDVGNGGCHPQLNLIGQYGFKYCFV